MIKGVVIRDNLPSALKELQKELLRLFEEDGEMSGEIPVELYNSRSKERVKLSHVYDISEIAINVLKEKYGDCNVKIFNA